MDSEEFEIPLFWPCVAIAIVYILGISAYWGTGRPAVAVSGVPAIVALIQHGITSFRNADFAIPGLIVAIGASLGAPSALHALKWVAIGAVCVLVPPILCIEWANIGGYAAFKPTDGLLPPGATSLSQVRSSSILLYVTLSLPLHLASMWLYTALSAATATIIIHFLLDRLNQLPAPWHSADGEDQDGEWIYEIGGGVAIMAVTVWFVFGSVLWPDPLRNPNAMAEDVVAALPPPSVDGPRIKTAEGRKYMKQELDNIADARDQVLKLPCSQAKRIWLSLMINDYFGQIRDFEDWRPGKELSSSSATARQRAETMLQQGLVGWDELKSPSRIHLDSEKYRSVVRTYPATCKSITS